MEHQDESLIKKATLAIIVQNGKVLLGEKKRGEIGTGTLNGPGGKQEKGETLVECMVREAHEELGIELDPAELEKIAVIQFFAGPRPDFEVHVYSTDVFRGTLRETDDMVPGWYDVDNLPYDRMLESDRTWFKKAVDGEHFTARVYYKGRAKDFDRIEFDSLQK